MQIHNPFGPPVPVPPPPLPAASLYTSLIPGPFILLLLLPSIPLLLFSIGARPPDTSALPFSMTEVFTTAAFVSIAGGVVLGLVVWPEMGKDFGGWLGASSGAVAQGRGTGGRSGWWTMIRSGMGGEARSAGQGYMAQSSSQAGQAQYQQAVGVGRRVASAAKIPKTQAGRAAARLYAIRSKFIHLYSPARVHTPTALGIIVLLLAVLVVVAGNLIRGIYELDGTSPPSSSQSRSGGSGRPETGRDGSELTPWVMSEIKKRQSELKAGKTPDQTLARFKKEAEGEKKQMRGKLEHLGAVKGKEYQAKKEKERAGELKMLLKRLEKLGLTTIGVEGADVVNAKVPGSEKKKATGGEEAGDDSGSKESGEYGDGGAGSEKRKWISWYKRSGDKPVKEKESVPFSEKFKKALIPVPLSSVTATSGLTRESARRDRELLMAGGGPPVPARGPGWEVADTPAAGAALAQSASNAESLAARMKAGG